MPTAGAAFFNNNHELVCAGEVLLTTAFHIDGEAQLPPGSASIGGAVTPQQHLGRGSSFQRSFRRSSSLTKPTQLALLGPGESFGDEVCGMPESNDEPRSVGCRVWLCGD